VQSALRKEQGRRICRPDRWAEIVQNPSGGEQRGLRGAKTFIGGQQFVNWSGPLTEVSLARVFAVSIWNSSLAITHNYRKKPETAFIYPAKNLAALSSTWETLGQTPAPGSCRG